MLQTYFRFGSQEYLSKSSAARGMLAASMGMPDRRSARGTTSDIAILILLRRATPSAPHTVIVFSAYAHLRCWRFRSGAIKNAAMCFRAMPPSTTQPLPQNAVPAF